MDDENWKVVSDAPHYAVSSLGRVKRIIPDRLNRPMRILATPLNDKGYPHLNLHVDGKQCLRRVHTLVCTAFHGPKPTPKHEVRHLDGNPLNARADNLCWGTSAENKADCRKHGTISRGERNGHAILREADIYDIRASKEKQTEIAARYGVTRSAIASIQQNRCWKHVA